MKIALKLIALLLLLAALFVLVPAATPALAAGSENMTPDQYPAYNPVNLTAEDITVLPYSQLARIPSQACYFPDGSGYLDSTVSVRTEMMRAYNTDIMLCWVQVADASQIRTELCKPYPSKATAKASVIAKRVNAVAAVNGDYFVYHSQGYIVRNGKLIREKYNHIYDTLIIDTDGDFHIVSPTTREGIAAYDGRIAHSLSFGPGLVIDGVKNEEYRWKGNAPTHRSQRIAIAQVDHLSYLIVATEGPENKGSTGLTLKEFAQLMSDLGVQNAYNLDGGSSSTIVINNKKVNSLSTHKVRAIGDILYFVTLSEDN